MRLLTISLTAATLALSSVDAQSTLNVPGTYPNIQAAINAAVNGDTVLVAPGIYLENIDVGGKDIVLQGSGAGLTTIDGSMVGPTVVFSAGSTRAAVIRDFTITGGNNTMATPPRANVGGGIRVVGCSPTIIDCTIRGNSADGYGGGIGVTGTGAGPLIERCTIVRNSATALSYSSGGGIGHTNGDPTGPSLEIRNCTVADNTAATRGAGIYVGYVSTADIDGNKITRNETLMSSNGLDGGAGIFVAIDSPVRVTNNRIWGNISATDGGGVKFFNVSGVQFVNNTIAGNTGGGVGGYANTAGNGVSADFVNCIIWQNGAANEFSFTGMDTNGQAPSANVSFCVVSGGFPGGTAIIVQSPQLLNIQSGNLRLTPGSPAIDNGTTTLATVPPTDFEGDTRPIGTGPDIGADEFDPGQRLLGADAATISAMSPMDVTYNVTNAAGPGAFALFFGVSGTEPGTDVLGLHAPLNVDFLTTAISLVGPLDATGSGSMTVLFSTLTIPSSLVGITLSSCALTVDSTGLAFTNDENVRVVP